MQNANILFKFTLDLVAGKESTSDRI